MPRGIRKHHHFTVPACPPNPFKPPPFPSVRTLATYACSAGPAAPASGLSCTALLSTSSAIGFCLPARMLSTVWRAAVAYCLADSLASSYCCARYVASMTRYRTSRMRRSASQKLLRNEDLRGTVDWVRCEARGARQGQGRGKEGHQHHPSI